MRSFFLRLFGQRKTTKLFHTSTVCNSKARVCIIGSGPAGFYTAHRLIKRYPEAEVDIWERLPVPYGLVRFGVAPDHPEVKNVINQFHALASNGKVNFIGNVEIGKSVSLQYLRDKYSAVVLAYGAANDQTLGIPGENLKGVYSARQFVGWYNGVPENKDLSPDLRGENSVIIGQGNVAIDVARMLVSGVELLKNTDICEHALETLRSSEIRSVYLVGRRGPLQAAFTIKELREMVKLPTCKMHIDLSSFPDLQKSLLDVARPRRRLTELLIKSARYNEETSQRHFNCNILFLRSPVEIIPDSTNHRVGGVKFEINRLEESPGGPRAVGTGKYEVVKCNTVFRSIGYKSTKVDDSIPFDHKQGIVINTRGRIHNENGVEVKGMYCSGWVKRGPVGVILTTMEDAFETAECIAQDLQEGKLNILEASEYDSVIKDLKRLGQRPVSFIDWEKIDNQEKELGRFTGKPREKIVEVKDMMKIIED